MALAGTVFVIVLSGCVVFELARGTNSSPTHNSWHSAGAPTPSRCSCCATAPKLSATGMACTRAIPGWRGQQTLLSAVRQRNSPSAATRSRVTWSCHDRSTGGRCAGCATSRTAPSRLLERCARWWFLFTSDPHPRARFCRGSPSRSWFLKPDRLRRDPRGMLTEEDDVEIDALWARAGLCLRSAGTRAGIARRSEVLGGAAVGAGAGAELP
jgi:hypothetical protein